MVFYIVKRGKNVQVLRSTSSLRNFLSVETSELKEILKQGNYKEWQVERVNAKLPVTKGKVKKVYVHKNDELDKKLESIQVDIESMKSFLAKLIWQIHHEAEKEESSQEISEREEKVE